MVDPSAVEHGIPTPPPPPPPAEIAQAEASQVQMDFDLAREAAISAAQAVQAAQEEAHAATQTASSIQQDLSDSAQAVQGEIQEEQPAAPEPAQPQPTQPASTPHQAPYQAPPPNNYQPGYYAAQQMSRTRDLVPHPIPRLITANRFRHHLPVINRSLLPRRLLNRLSINRKDWPLLPWCWESVPSRWEVWFVPFWRWCFLPESKAIIPTAIWVPMPLM